MKEYHKDYEYMSKSFLTKFAISPAHAFHYMTQPQETTPAMTFGRVYHSIIAGDHGSYAVFDPDERPEGDKTMASKANKEWKAQFYEIAENNGLDVISAEEFGQITKMVARLKENPVVQKINSFDLVQEKAFRAEIDGLKIKCKPDGLQIGRGENKENLVIDWKTCSSVAPEKIKYDIQKFGYDVQAAMYCEIMSELNDNRETNFLFIFQEKNEPYDVLPVLVSWDSATMQVGSDKWRDYYIQAMRCFETGKWPGVSSRFDGGALIVE